MFDINDATFAVDSAGADGWRCAWVLAHGGVVQVSDVAFGSTPVTAMIHAETAARQAIFKLRARSPLYQLGGAS